jgi:hypothetical protein
VVNAGAFVRLHTIRAANRLAVVLVVLRGHLVAVGNAVPTTR